MDIYSIRTEPARRSRQRLPASKHSIVVAFVLVSMFQNLQSTTMSNLSGSLFIAAFHASPIRFPKSYRNEREIDSISEFPSTTRRSSLVFLSTNTNESNNDDLSLRSSVPQASAAVTSHSARTIRVERMPRLPVWPVWAGVVDFFVGLIFGPEAGSKLEQYILGGRVCPMQLDGSKTSPFLLLVHHHHNFWKWDAIFRKLSAFVLPEGFPAHPHRGFTTLTYFLPEHDGAGGGGGFVHRDSIGVKQTYGTMGSYRHQAQWLLTGSGMLHEEMFDFAQDDFVTNNYKSRYELYQLWVNVPSNHKLDPPKVQLLRTTDANEATTDTDSSREGTMPTVFTTSTSGSTTTKSNVVVIAGNYQPCKSDNDAAATFQSQVEPLHSDMSILHVTVTDTEKEKLIANEEGSTAGWVYNIPHEHDTLIIYVRKGSCTMETIATSTSGKRITSGETQVPIHSTVFIEKTEASTERRYGSREQLVVRPSQLDDPLDLFVLSGRPLYEEDSFNVEPVSMQGSMVMNENMEIQVAYRDYQLGQMGIPWDHELTDEEWKEHVRQTSALVKERIGDY